MPSSEYQQAIREKVAQGMASAKAGRLVDGEAVFTRLYAELDALGPVSLKAGFLTAGSRFRRKALVI